MGKTGKTGKTAKLLWAYLPLFVWSLIAAVWTFWHSPFTLVFALAYLAIIGVSFAVARTVAIAIVLGAVGACHTLGAFALHTWLHLPIWTVPMFLVASIGLLVALGVRGRIGARGGR